jgi:hypothetical protein
MRKIDEGRIWLEDGGATTAVNSGERRKVQHKRLTAPARDNWVLGGKVVFFFLSRKM